MDWISFFWGVGALIFINIVIALWVYPKQLKERDELDNSISALEEKLSSLKVDHEESMKSWEENAVNLRLELDKLTASFKLRKSCPACGIEFPLYIMEKK